MFVLAEYFDKECGPRNYAIPWQPCKRLCLSATLILRPSYRVLHVLNFDNDITRIADNGYMWCSTNVLRIWEDKKYPDVRDRKL